VASASRITAVLLRRGRVVERPRPVWEFLEARRALPRSIEVNLAVDRKSHRLEFEGGQATKPSESPIFDSLY
jgi:hypothetical protein